MSEFDTLIELINKKEIIEAGAKTVIAGILMYELNTFLKNYESEINKKISEEIKYFKSQFFKPRSKKPKYEEVSIEYLLHKEPHTKKDSQGGLIPEYFEICGYVTDLNYLKNGIIGEISGHKASIQFFMAHKPQLIHLKEDIAEQKIKNSLRNERRIKLQGRFEKIYVQQETNYKRETHIQEFPLTVLTIEHIKYKNYNSKNLFDN